MQQIHPHNSRLPHFNPDKPDTREGGDDALEHLVDDEQMNESDAGYSNEERIVEDEEGINKPDDERPSGTGIPSKE